MFLSFLGKLVLFILFIVMMFIAVLYMFPSMVVPSKSISIFIVLFGVTAGVHYVVLRAGRGDAAKFTNFIILSVVIKLFLYAVFTFLLIISDRQGAMANVVLFFIVYIMLTVFELTIMYNQVNRINSN